MVVDASVWMSALIPSDEFHEVSRQWLTAVLGNGLPLVDPVLVLAEVGGAIARTTGKSELGRRAIAQLLDIPTLRLVSVDHELGIAAGQLAAENRLRGADATYVAVAAAVNLPLVSWDNQQLERASAVVRCFRPGEVPPAPNL